MARLNELQTTTDPILVGLGYGAGWQPVQAAVPPIPATASHGFHPHRQRRHRARRARQRIRRIPAGAHDWRRASGLADAASFLTFVRQSGAAYYIAIKPTARASHIHNGACPAGSFNTLFSRVGMMHGFQHTSA